MDTLPYTNREIDSKHKEMMAILGRIETQTTETNGKVANIQIWKEQIKGGLKVFSVILLTILTVFGWALIKVVNLDSTIHTIVSEELTTYEVTILE